MSTSIGPARMIAHPSDEDDEDMMLGVCPVESELNVGGAAASVSVAPVNGQVGLIPVNQDWVAGNQDRGTFLKDEKFTTDSGAVLKSAMDDIHLIINNNGNPGPGGHRTILSYEPKTRKVEWKDLDGVEGFTTLLTDGKGDYPESIKALDAALEKAGWHVKYFQSYSSNAKGNDNGTKPFDLATNRLKNFESTEHDKLKAIAAIKNPVDKMNVLTRLETSTHFAAHMSDVLKSKSADFERDSKVAGIPQKEKIRLENISKQLKEKAAFFEKKDPKAPTEEARFNYAALDTAILNPIGSTTVVKDVMDFHKKLVEQIEIKPGDQPKNNVFSAVCSGINAVPIWPVTDGIVIGANLIARAAGYDGTDHKVVAAEKPCLADMSLLNIDHRDPNIRRELTQECAKKLGAEKMTQTPVEFSLGIEFLNIIEYSAKNADNNVVQDVHNRILSEKKVQEALCLGLDATLDGVIVGEIDRFAQTMVGHHQSKSFLPVAQAPVNGITVNIAGAKNEMEIAGLYATAVRNRFRGLMAPPPPPRPVPPVPVPPRVAPAPRT